MSRAADDRCSSVAPGRRRWESVPHDGPRHKVQAPDVVQPDRSRPHRAGDLGSQHGAAGSGVPHVIQFPRGDAVIVDGPRLAHRRDVSPAQSSASGPRHTRSPRAAARPHRVFPARVNRLSSTALSGLPCPMKRAGINSPPAASGSRQCRGMPPRRYRPRGTQGAEKGPAIHSRRSHWCSSP